MLTPDNQSSSIRVNPTRKGEEDSKFVTDAVDKPRDAPQSETSFKDVLDKKKSKKENKGIGTGVARENGESTTVSIFDLPGKKDQLKRFSKREGKEDDASKDGDEIVAINDLPKGLTHTDTKARFDVVMDGVGVPAAKLSGKASGEFAQEQSDISYVNPLGANQLQSVHVSGDVKAQHAMPARTQLQEAVTQILDKVYTLEVKGQTNTVLTLNHPTLFKGAEIVLTAFDHAKGEFNIGFHNLTQAAMQVIQTEQATLRHALEEKGYMVHIVVITSNPVETRIAAEDARFQGQGEEGGQGEQQQQRRKRDDEEQG